MHYVKCLQVTNQRTLELWWLYKRPVEINISGPVLKGPLSYKYIFNDLCWCVWVYTSQNHYLLDLNVHHIFLNNISFIFLYCTKPRLLKNPKIIICLLWCQKSKKISITIHNIMHLAITRCTCLTKASHVFLTTFLFKAILKHFWHSTHFYSLKGCEVVLYEVCDAFVSKWPSYGKVHNVLYRYAYFCLQWHYRRSKGMICGFLEGGA